MTKMNRMHDDHLLRGSKPRLPKGTGATSRNLILERTLDFSETFCLIVPGANNITYPVHFSSKGLNLFQTV